MSRGFWLAEEAVSEAIDFSILLGIMILALGLVAVVGYPMLQHVQEERHLENTRQAFAVLASAINKVALGQAPSRTVELQLYGESINVRDTGTSEISVNSYTGGGVIETSIGDARIAYEGGGVWIQYPRGGAVVYPPPISNKSTVIPVITIKGVSSVGGKGNVRIRVSLESQTIEYIGTTVIINVNSDYIDGWRDYFRQQGWENSPPSTEFKAKFASDTPPVYVLNSTVRVEVLS